MVRVRHGKPSVIRGKHEVHGNDELNTWQREHLFPDGVPKQNSDEWVDRYVMDVLERRVNQARQDGWTVEEIQQGHRNE